MTKKTVFILSMLIVSCLHAGIIFGDSQKRYQQKMLVGVPVVDVRLVPESLKDGLVAPALHKDMPDQHTQVLFGERVLAYAMLDKPDWVSVVIGRHKDLTDSGKWIGCHAFMRKAQLIEVPNFTPYNIVLQDLWTNLYTQANKTSAVFTELSFGTMLYAKKNKNDLCEDWFEVSFADKKYYISGLACVYEFPETGEIIEPVAVLREKIVSTACTLLHTPYVWGGRSALNLLLKDHVTGKTQITGIDCSGFVNLAYQAGAALAVPGCAQSQKKICQILKNGLELKPADVIFLYDETVGRITHAALYMGNGLILESLYTSREIPNKTDVYEKHGVGIISVKDKFGVELKDLETGKSRYVLDGRIAILGSFLNSEETLKKLRLIAVGCQDVSW